MFSFVARRSLALTSRGYHIARSMTVAVNVRPPQISKCVLARHARPVSTSCFRFAADSGVSSGKEIVLSAFRGFHIKYLDPYSFVIYCVVDTSTQVEVLLLLYLFILSIRTLT